MQYFLFVNISFMFLVFLAWLHLGLLWQVIGRTRISPEVEHFMHEFWELIAFVANVIIFIVVGVVIAQNAHPTGMDFLILGLVYIGIHLVRAINMGTFYPLMKKSGYGLPWERCNRSMVGCIKRSNWFGTGFGCLHRKFPL